MTSLRTFPDGYFVTLEGPEGAGKTTQQAMLVGELRQRGYDVLQIREPGGTLLGERIREILLKRDASLPLCAEAELLLFGASRVQVVQEVILPHLQSGGIVVCDRFIDSTTVYQGSARGLDPGFITEMHRFCTHARLPDLTFLLDLQTQIGFDRVITRDGKAAEDDRFQSEASAFHDRVRSGFLELAREHPLRIRTVQADAPAPAVHAAIMEIFDCALG